MTPHRTTPSIRTTVACLSGVVALAVSTLALAPPSTSFATTSFTAASDSAIIDAARHDRPVPPDRCIYDPSPKAWPPADETRACLRYNGTGKTVMLFGDSHAEHWAPAFYRIAQLRNWKLYTLTRPRCSPMNYIAVRPTDNGRPTVGDICANWRKVAYPTVIKRYDPALVFFGGRSQVYDIRVDDRIIRQGTDDWMPAWRKSWRWTVRTLRAKGARVAALTLQPTMDSNIPNCLDINGLRTAECNMRLFRDRQTFITNRFILNVNAVYPLVRPIPVNKLVCPNGLCKARTDGLITFADMSHLTARWSRAHGEEILPMLRARNRL